jgi:hypothetical protein
MVAHTPVDDAMVIMAKMMELYRLGYATKALVDEVLAFVVKSNMDLSDEDKSSLGFLLHMWENYETEGSTLKNMMIRMVGAKGYKRMMRELVAEFKQSGW